MNGQILFDSIEVSNLLSFGPTGQTIDLVPLNVLIGTNGSGKSNFLDLFSVVNSLPTDLQLPFRQTGGISQWQWKGQNPGNLPKLTIYTKSQQGLIQHFLYILPSPSGPNIISETVHRDEILLFSNASFGVNAGSKLVYDPGKNDQLGEVLEDENFGVTQSIVQQIKDSRRYAGITFLGSAYQSIVQYHDFGSGRLSQARQPLPSDVPGVHLAPDASNLAAVLNELLHLNEPKRKIISALTRFNRNIEDVRVRAIGASIQIYVYEKGLSEGISAVRLSDGTMKFLALLSVLCHPKPPKFITIEEPEVGLHPDVMPVLAELLVQASERAQLVVTTHSESLVSALSTVPESVIVCERTEEGTSMNRLEPERLKTWLEDYSLGDLWRKGELGGVL